MINYSGLFHVSEEPGIQIFEPRPSPSFFSEIDGDVVFAIAGKMLHSYLLPRDCPRVCYYVSSQTTAADKERFFGSSGADYIINVEATWHEKIIETVLYCYELPGDTFKLIDECAGYYVSYQPIIPVSVIVVTDSIAEMQARNVELRFMSCLIKFAAEVSRSTLKYSTIRMRNARM